MNAASHAAKFCRQILAKHQVVRAKARYCNISAGLELS